MTRPTHSNVKRAAGAALLAACLVAVSPTPSLAIDLGVLVPHRAIYDLRLKEASERSGIEAMQGRIAYEVTGNRCDGFSIRYRFVTNITTADESYETDQQTASYESPDGTEFTFITRTFVDRRPERTVKGRAVRTDAGVSVALEAPEERDVELPDAIFISTHLAELIRQARQGDQFVRHEVFDGSNDADEVVVSAGVIGRAQTYPKALDGEDAQAVAALANSQAWPVTVSYFEQQGTDPGEQLPVYEASFLLYPNGISRRLVMRYDDYALSGQLTGLEMLDPGDCEVPG